MNKPLIFCQYPDCLKENGELFSFYEERRKKVIGISKKNAYFKRMSKTLEQLFELNNLRRRLNLLYVGCGFAEEMMELASKHSSNSYSCLDINPYRIELVNIISKYHNLPIEGKTGDACKLPYEDSTFDMVYSKHFFEHVWDKDLAIKEQIRILKKEGKLVIIDGNILNPKGLIEILFKTPTRTNGRSGGFRWLLTKKIAKKGVYAYEKSLGMDWYGKDEDIKSVFWWRKYLSKFKNEIHLEILTTRRSFLIKNNILQILARPFYGNIVIVCKKFDDGRGS